MKIITHNQWFPEHGAFQTRRNNGITEARHTLGDFFIQNNKAICEEIYRIYKLLPYKYEDLWVYFR